jgi:DtxR family Mn-dependent transcriptional regulator
MKEEIENALKDIWMKSIEDKRDIDETEVELLVELRKNGYVTTKGGKVYLTERGEKLAEKVIRLHRLAERLLTDIVGMRESSIEEHACRFEHVIDDEAEEAICTLLGHPRVCPHGRRIPEGSCCTANEKEVERVIFRLSELSPGDEAEVKYIVAGDEESKILISSGIIPGVKIKVLRVYPAFVVQMGNTQFALDRNLAECIYTIRG